ncbi:MAG: gliding motility-associated C-terminal domain-containing protein [Saprospiraceae bacterium]|nr:gliding motility-associated C-terminal domain-containing protein [Saprospiraceae bacterium]MCF8250330.1 gliding motility-associated C-terminal domain-containing protein [Saprospiraceae bacterium]MCF8281512.1 gliding motility-associated C-terminal domain-containing protein [Bacteroidales bacterium]MCF8312138.1 gliding motility-associated C-terminal domain-containing protein [Saprospiraceae bacterium]MCF8442190.1 gliding motility-associated C-terminal domain-containing protein [Saprospiraceae 
MKRPITNLAIGLFALFATHLAAQPTFSVNPQTITANVGDNFTVDIVVSDFDNILSFQYSMNWNSAVLEFVSPVGNITPSQLPGINGSSFGLTGTGNGFLGVSWSDPNASGVTAADGTVLYSLTFHVLSSQPAVINFGNAPTPQEVYDGDGVNLTAGTTFIGASVNGGSGGGGGGGGGGGPTNGFAVIASDETAAPGAQICVDVTVNDFTNILSMQYTMEFNESNWQLANIPAGSYGLPGLTAGSFGTNQGGQGLITFSWSDPNASGVTVPNGTVIYQVCLDAIGAANCGSTTLFDFNSAVTPVEVYNGNSQQVTFQGVPGDLEICGGGGGGGGPVNGFAVIASDETAASGAQICVDVTVNDFTNILSMQYTMEFNESKWLLANIPAGSYGLPGLTAGSFGTNQGGQGLITFSWSDPNATGVTVPNGTVIYQVCLNAIGPNNCGATTPFQFNSAVTPVEVYNGNSQQVTFQGITGDLEICDGGGGGGGNTDLTFIAGEVESPTGSQICVDFTVENFDCIVSAQYTIHFNQAISQFASVQAFGLPDLTSANFGPPAETANGILRFSWASPDPVNGSTVADGTVIFQVCFNVIGANGSVGNITFNGDPLLVEVGSCNSPNVIPTFDPGSVTVGITCTGPVTIATPPTITNVACAGQSNGGVAITVAGGSATKTYVWKNAAGTTVGTSQNLTGVPAGAYSVTVTSCGGVQTATSGPHTVTQPTALSLNFTSQDIACFGETNGAVDITVTGGTNTGTGCTGYTYAWSNGATTQDITGLAAGNYTVTVTDCKACTIVSSPAYTISAPTSALAATATSTNILCNGGANGSITITATGGGNTKEYRLNTGTWVATNVFNNLVPGTYSAQARDNFGCVKTSSVTITEPSPIVIIFATTNPTQGQNNGAIATTITGGTAPFSCAWSGPNGQIQGCNPTGLGAGTYCVTVTDANMCTKAKCGPVYAPMGEDPANPSKFKNACAGVCNGLIEVNVIGGVTTPPYTYAWTPSTVPPIRNPTGLCPGTYTVTVTSPSIGQTFVQTFTIAQPTQPPSVVATNLEVPTSSASINGSITLSTQGGSGSGYTYQWSGTTQTTNPIFGLGEGCYSTTITDGNGCTGTAGPYCLDYVPVPLDSPQVSTINACALQNNGKVTLSISGGTPPYKYQISGTPTQVFTTSETTHTFSNLAGGIHTFSITDGGTGVDQQSKTGTVTVDETTLTLSPAPVITHATGTQIGQLGHVNIEVTGGQSVGYTYQWNNGATSQDLFNIGQGCYSVTVTDPSSGCAAAFNDIGVGLLTATFTDDKPDCPQETGSITATPSLSPSCAVPNLSYTYKWTNAQGTSVGNQQTLTPVLPGVYTVSITDNNGSGISITQSHELKAVSNLSVTANVTTNYNGFDIRCFGGNGGAAIAVPLNGLAPYTYTWSNNKTTQAVNDLSAGINYTVTIEDQQGCTMSAMLELKGPTQISAEANASASGCTPGDSGQASVTVGGGVQPYIYSWSNGDKDPTADNLTPGNNYSVTVTDFNGCTMIENVEVPDIVPLSAMGFSESDSGGPNGVAGVIVTGGTWPYTFFWPKYPEVTDSVLTELFPGEYLVRVTDANGCQVSKIIKVDDDTECGEVRTIITPEGDGKNETFLIKCLSRFNDNTLEIYNRWGQLVYRTEDYNDDNLWRGTTVGGDDVPDGVYFYVFNYFDPGTNAFVTKKGSVTVLRK